MGVVFIIPKSTPMTTNDILLCLLLLIGVILMNRHMFSSRHAEKKKE